MIDFKAVKKMFSVEFKKRTYRKKGDTWILEKPGLILIVNLQKSNYDDVVFINIGIVFREVGELKLLKEQLCHLRIRADRVLDGSEVLNLKQNCNVEEH